MKKLGIFLLTIMMLISLTCVADAGSVTYYQDSDEFIVNSENAGTPTDLFEDFKDVMPGVTYHDTVILKNDASNENSIKVYIKSYGSSTETTAFLSHLYLTVRSQSESTLFEAPASESAQLSDWVYLGTIHPGGEIPLSLELLVDPELDNEFQENVGYLKWAFMVEGVDEPAPEPEPEPEPDPDPSKTGDDSLLWQYSMITLLSIMLLCVFIKGTRRKRRKRKN